MQVPPPLHPWNLAPAEAQRVQRELATRVERTDRLGEVRTVAGIDISANDHTGMGRAAVVLLSFPELEEIAVAREERSLSMPYVPGLLSFRESPIILGAMARLAQPPDLLMVDGQGIAHPRRFGIASHLGLLLDLPAIGCAKSILRGKHAPLPDEVGAQAQLVDGSEVVGMAVRTRRHSTPIYISIGHRISLETAVRYVLNCCRGYRLPEPTRLAHLRAGERGGPPEASEGPVEQGTLPGWPRSG
jgi:deoxyribonuclease V